MDVLLKDCTSRIWFVQKQKGEEDAKKETCCHICTATVGFIIGYGPFTVLYTVIERERVLIGT